MSQDTNTRIFEAVLLISQSKIYDAISEFQKIIEEDPFDYLAYNLKANSLQILDREEEALSTINQYLSICDKNAYAWNQKGEILLDIKQAKEAEFIFKKALALNLDSIRSLSGLGKSLLFQEKYNEALLIVDKAISKKVDSVDLWMLRSSIYCELQNYESALMCVETAIQNKRDVTKKIELANENIENKKNEWEDSISELSSTKYESKVDNLMKVVNMIQVKDELDKKYEIGTDLDELENRDSGNFALEKLHLIKSELLIRINRKNEALESLCEASKLNPQNTEYWFAQGNLCRELGLFDEAVHKYEMILEFDPRNKLALYGKSISLYKANLVKEALESFEVLVSMYQDDEQLWMQYGLLALDFGTQNNENSIIYRSSHAFLQAEKLNQNNIEAWLYAAIAYKRIDSINDAECCLNRAIEIDIEFVRARVEGDVIFQPLKDLESGLSQILEDLRSQKATGKNILERIFRRFF